MRADVIKGLWAFGALGAVASLFGLGALIVPRDLQESQAATVGFLNDETGRRTDAKAHPTGRSTRESDAVRTGRTSSAPPAPTGRTRVSPVAPAPTGRTRVSPVEPAPTGRTRVSPVEPAPTGRTPMSPAEPEPTGRTPESPVNPEPTVEPAPTPIAEPAPETRAEPAPETRAEPAPFPKPVSVSPAESTGRTLRPRRLVATGRRLLPSGRLQHVLPSGRAIELVRVAAGPVKIDGRRRRVPAFFVEVEPASLSSYATFLLDLKARGESLAGLFPKGGGQAALLHDHIARGAVLPDADLESVTPLAANAYLQWAGLTPLGRAERMRAAAARHLPQDDLRGGAYPK